MEERIRDVVERLLRPLVAADGGTLEIVKIEENGVTLRLGGTCNGCPGAPFTRQRIVERAIRTAVKLDIRIDFEQTAPALPRSLKTA